MPSSTPPFAEALIAARLRAAGCVFAEDEARLLVAESSSSAEREARIGRRIRGEPLEQILGWAEFCGLRLAVEPGVFVPRRRTEFLARQAISLARPITNPVVLDLCCGVGAIGAAIVAATSDARLFAVDIQPAAVRCARRNVGTGGQIFEGDLFGPLPRALRGHVDIVVANAPYVPTGSIALMPSEARLHEARLTLDGGDDGLDVHRRIAAEVSGWLADGGRVLIESSADQAQRSAELFEAHGLATEITHWEETDSTVVIAARPPD